jgi:hypothetical protein
MFDGFIAGEDLRPGDLVTIGDDGKVYRLRTGEPYLFVITEPAKAEAVIFPSQAPFKGVIVVHRSRRYRLKTWFRKLLYCLRGKYYPYLD